MFIHLFPSPLDLQGPSIGWIDGARSNWSEVINIYPPHSPALQKQSVSGIIVHVAKAKANWLIRLQQGWRLDKSITAKFLFADSTRHNRSPLFITDCILFKWKMRRFEGKMIHYFYYIFLPFGHQTWLSHCRNSSFLNSKCKYDAFPVLLIFALSIVVAKHTKPVAWHENYSVRSMWPKKGPQSTMETMGINIELKNHLCVSRVNCWLKRYKDKAPPTSFQLTQN